MRISDWSSDVCSSDLVPDFCLFKFNVRTQHPSDEGWLQESLDRIVRTLGGDGIVFEIRGGFTRPPKPLNAAQQKLMDWTLDCGRALDLHFEFKPTGGCCDGNNLEIGRAHV